jgi:hypothetical protein
VKEIDRRFNLNELRTVCFDAGIPYESFSHDNKLAMTREMVQYAQRHSMDRRLFAALVANNSAFRLEGEGIEISEPEIVEEPVTPPVMIVNEEKERLIEMLRYEPSIGAIAEALVYIIRRL